MRITKRQLLRIIREEHQGYDAREDESLGMRRGPEHDHSESEEDRREDSYGKWGKRGRGHASSRNLKKYFPTTSHEDEQGYDDREDESLGMRRGAERDHSESDEDRREDSYGKWGTRSHHESRIRKNRLRQIVRRILR
ncbi:MAG TPA: hypothetical protein EYG51_10150 [Pseudomonadales bacterium]|nr:hypothetical protein [Pseudomonadales bacterium]